MYNICFFNITSTIFQFTSFLKIKKEIFRVKKQKNVYNVCESLLCNELRRGFAWFPWHGRDHMGNEILKDSSSRKGPAPQGQMDAGGWNILTQPLLLQCCCMGFLKVLEKGPSTGGSKQQACILSQFWGWWSNVDCIRRAVFPLQDLIFVALSSLWCSLAIFGVPGLGDTSLQPLPLSSRDILPGQVCVSSSSFSHMRTQVVGLNLS